MKIALKEIILGIGLALLVFFARQGFEITPFILIGAVVLLLKFTMDNRTNNRFTLVEQKESG